MPATQRTPYKLLAVVLFAAIAIVSRFVGPTLFGHPSNFAPVDAVALFCGAYVARNWLRLAIPLLFVWLGDIIVNYGYYGKVVLFYEGFYWQYASYLLIVLLGAGLLRNQVSVVRVLGGAVSAATLFFLISNFGVWASGHGLGYSPDLSGLLTCYAAGLPFYQQSLLSDIVYCAVLFGSMEALRYWRPAMVLQSAKA